MKLALFFISRFLFQSRKYNKRKVYGLLYVGVWFGWERLMTYHANKAQSERFWLRLKTFYVLIEC